jgi:hypothetical protein
MDWKKAIGAVAPSLLRAIGGPFGSVAANALTSVLGVDANDEKALEAKVLSMTAADLLALKQADQQFQKDMRALGIDEAKIEAADRADARAREIATHDWVVKVLALSVFTLFAAVVVGLQRFEIPAQNRDAANQVLGILYAAVVSVLGYYFGSSAGSRAKDALIGKK